jgi:hypothetical protein
MSSDERSGTNQVQNGSTRPSHANSGLPFSNVFLAKDIVVSSILQNVFLRDL